MAQRAWRQKSALCSMPSALCAQSETPLVRQLRNEWRFLFCLAQKIDFSKSRHREIIAPARRFGFLALDF